MNVSMWRDSLPGMYSSTLEPLTSPAKRQANADASNFVTLEMPERPASRLAQPSATVLPTGLISPRPVMTTRRRMGEPDSGLLVLHCVVDRQLHGGDLLRLFIGDLDAELVLEGHHQFHRVERVGAEVGHEGFLVGDVGLGHAELLGDDFLDTGFDIAH